MARLGIAIRLRLIFSLSHGSAGDNPADIGVITAEQTGQSLADLSLGVESAAALDHNGLIVTGHGNIVFSVFVAGIEGAEELVQRQVFAVERFHKVIAVGIDELAGLGDIVIPDTFHPVFVVILVGIVFIQIGIITTQGGAQIVDAIHAGLIDFFPLIGDQTDFNFAGVVDADKVVIIQRDVLGELFVAVLKIVEQPCKRPRCRRSDNGCRPRRYGY